jgi:hypothetical protein
MTSELTWTDLIKNWCLQGNLSKFCVNWTGWHICQYQRVSEFFWGSSTIGSDQKTFWNWCNDSFVLTPRDDDDCTQSRWSESKSTSTGANSRADVVHVEGMVGHEKLQVGSGKLLHQFPPLPEAKTMIYILLRPLGFGYHQPGSGCPSVAPSDCNQTEGGSDAPITARDDPRA